MFLSVFELFKIGIGPSSSHTMGPMTAAARFLDLLRDRARREPDAPMPVALRATLYGSLAFTGKGHATDRAVRLGLLGFLPAEIEMTAAEQGLADLAVTRTLRPKGLPAMAFDPDHDVVFDFGPALAGHANGLVFEAFDDAGKVCCAGTYYSIGGGFVVSEAERLNPASASAGEAKAWPYPFSSAEDMLLMARRSGKSIAEMKRANELVVNSTDALDDGLVRIWGTMSGCIDRGLALDGELPGGLKVRRRAKNILGQLAKEAGSNRIQPHVASDWLSVYRDGGQRGERRPAARIVTAPTNGAAGDRAGRAALLSSTHCVGCRARPRGLTTC
jgi:L-serine dehydratase